MTLNLLPDRAEVFEANLSGGDATNDTELH